MKNATKDAAKALASEVVAEFRIRVDEKLEESMTERAAAEEAGVGRSLEELEERARRLTEAKARECDERVEAVEMKLEDICRIMNTLVNS